MTYSQKQQFGGISRQKGKGCRLKPAAWLQAAGLEAKLIMGSQMPARIH
jgi:hypothetical protein